MIEDRVVITSGSGAPSDLNGSDSDWYLDTDNGDKYLKISGVWTLRGGSGSGGGGDAAFAVNTFEYTSGVGQVVYSGADDNANDLDLLGSTALVSVNGTWISPDEYTYDDTSVTLNLAPPTGVDVCIWGLNAAVQLPSLSETVQDTVYAGTIQVDCSQGSIIDFSLTGDATVNFIGGFDGQMILLRIRQDIVGSRIVTWGTMCRGSISIPLPILSVNPGALDYVGFRFNSTDSTFDCLAANKGFI